MYNWSKTGGKDGKGGFSKGKNTKRPEKSLIKSNTARKPLTDATLAEQAAKREKIAQQ